jgi:vacuolar-type H+-ATPase subunit E/Vma4
MATALLNYQEAMSRERFKQEVALRVVDRMLEAVGHQIQKRFEKTYPENLRKSLNQFEELQALVVGAVAESIAEQVAVKMGPDMIPLADLV